MRADSVGDEKSSTHSGQVFGKFYRIWGKYVLLFLYVYGIIWSGWLGYDVSWYVWYVCIVGTFGLSVWYVGMYVCMVGMFGLYVGMLVWWYGWYVGLVCLVCLYVGMICA